MSVRFVALRFRRVVTIVLIDIYELLGLKVFGYSVYFLLGFGRERRRRWALLIVTGVGLGASLLELPLVEGDAWREF